METKILLRNILLLWHVLGTFQTEVPGTNIAASDLPNTNDANDWTPLPESFPRRLGISSKILKALFPSRYLEIAELKENGWLITGSPLWNGIWGTELRVTGETATPVTNTTEVPVSTSTITGSPWWNTISGTTVTVTKAESTVTDTTEVPVSTSTVTGSTELPPTHVPLVNVKYNFFAKNIFFIGENVFN